MLFTLSKNKLAELRELARWIDEEDGPQAIFGWRRICERAPVYLDRERLLVLKQPRLILNSRTPLKFRVPTIKVDDYGWVAQPYVQKKRTKLAKELLAWQLGNIHCDLHSGNVGWWNGKPLLFDW